MHNALSSRLSVVGSKQLCVAAVYTVQSPANSESSIGYHQVAIAEDVLRVEVMFDSSQQTKSRR